MKYKFDKFADDLEKLLRKHYKNKWIFDWRGLDNGFELVLQVFKKK